MPDLEIKPHGCPHCPQRFARADLLEKYAPFEYLLYFCFFINYSYRHLYTKSHEKRKRREEKLQQKADKDSKRLKADTDTNVVDVHDNVHNIHDTNPSITPAQACTVIPISPSSQQPSLQIEHNQPLPSHIVQLPQIPYPLEHQPFPRPIQNISTQSQSIPTSGFDFGVHGIDNYSWLFGTNFLLDMDSATSPSIPGPNSSNFSQAGAVDAQVNNFRHASNILSRHERSVNALFQNPKTYCEMDTLIGVTEQVPSNTSDTNYPRTSNLDSNITSAAFNPPITNLVQAPSDPHFAINQSLQQQQPLLPNPTHQHPPLNWNQQQSYNSQSAGPAISSPDPLETIHPLQQTPTPSSPNAKRSTLHFDVSESKQRQMVETLSYIPCLPQHLSLFTASRISDYLKLFWRYFDVVYPVIHKPTFDTSKSEPELLIAMTTIGMAYSASDSVYNLAIEIHRKFRNMLLVKVDDQPQVPLWVHQSLLLTNHFVKMLGSRNQHAMSEMFHGTNIALLKLSGYLSDLKEPTPTALLNAEQDDTHHQDKDLLSQYWKEWIEYECRKRITFFAFICDTQHATLFRHTQGFSAFEINLELPCTDACWTASSAQSFWKCYKLQPQGVKPRPPPNQQDGVSSYLWDSFGDLAKSSHTAVHNYSDASIDSNSNNNNNQSKDVKSKVITNRIRGEGNWPSLLFSIRRLMSPYRESQKEYSLHCFSQFSRLILLHGLLSICWDSQWRGLLDMGIVSKRRMSDFRIRLIQAISSWREYFDRQLQELNTPDFNLLLSANGEVSYRKTDPDPNRAANITVLNKHEADANAAAVPVNTTVLNRHNTDEDGENYFQLNYFGNSPLLCANWSLYNFSLVALYADTLSLQTFAECMSTYSSYMDQEWNRSSNVNPDGESTPKETSLLARQQAVARSLEQLRAQKVVYGWAATEDSKWAVWHCAHFLSKVLSNRALLSQADYVPWCVYLSVLCVWAYEVAQAAQSSQDELSSAPYIINEGSEGNEKKDKRFKVNEHKARHDAFEYLAMVQRVPPKSIHTTPTASEDNLYSSQQQHVKTGALKESSSERQVLIMSLVAYVYVIFEKYDRGIVVTSKPLLYGLLDQYNNGAAS